MARLQLFSTGTTSSLNTYTVGTQWLSSAAPSALLLLAWEAQSVKVEVCPNTRSKMKYLKTATIDNRKCLFTIYQIYAAPGMHLPSWHHPPPTKSHSFCPSKGRTVWSQLSSQRSCLDARRFSLKLWSLPSGIGNPRKSICKLKKKEKQRKISSFYILGSF